MKSRYVTSKTRTAKRAAAAALTVTLGAGVAVTQPSVAWAASENGTGTGSAVTASGERSVEPVADKRTPPRSLATYVARADAALSRATSQLHADHPVRTIKALDRLSINVRRAHARATAEIGRPPADPESDDLPGPPAVSSAVALDHRIGMRLVPTLDGLHRPVVSREIQSALWVTYHQRRAMLGKVIALPPEGAGEDYADGLADTLPQYSQEVTQLTSAQTTYQLTTTGAATVAGALVRVRATQRSMEAAYGGGEK